MGRGGDLQAFEQYTAILARHHRYMPRSTFLVFRLFAAKRHEHDIHSSIREHLTSSSTSLCAESTQSLGGVEAVSRVRMSGSDALLALGILVNLVKGGDILLRPHQRRTAQSLLAHWPGVWSRPTRAHGRPRCLAQRSCWAF